MQKIAFFVSWPILNALFLKLSLFLEFLDFSPKSSIFVQKFDFGKSLGIFAKKNEAKFDPPYILKSRSVRALKSLRYLY